MWLCKQFLTLGMIIVPSPFRSISTTLSANFEVCHPRCVSNKSNVKCIQYDVKHNLVLDGILVLLDVVYV